MNTTNHLSALARLYSPSRGELTEFLIDAAHHQAELAAQLNPNGPGSEARIDAFLAHCYGMQKTALRLRALIGGANG